MRFLVGIVAAACFQLCQAKTVTYDFNLTWVNADPDGLHERKVLGVNGQWPLPIIEVEKGDRLVVNMHNSLGDKTSSIHWHGLYQNGTNNMDGPSMVTQCPVLPGYSYTYNFTIEQTGTFWYHCHVDACYPDGQRQALVVRDKDAYFADEINGDITLTMSDWYHDMTENLSQSFLSPTNPDGDEPIPNSFLFNDAMNTSIPVEPGKTYMLRLVNIGAFVSQYFYIEGHSFRIVEIDGVYTEPTEAEILYIAVAQRYSILVTAKNTTHKNFPIVTVADAQLLDSVPDTLKLNQTNWLQYNASAPHPQAVLNITSSTQLNPFDDMGLYAYDQMELLPEPDITITVNVAMQEASNGEGYAYLNNISYTKPKVPTLYSVLSSGSLATNPKVYGNDTNPYVLGHNQVVEIVLNNNDTGAHPFHLHGHTFQLLDRFPPYGPHFFDYADTDYRVTYNPNNHTAFPKVPARRDTFVVPPQGYFVIRFVADNPGVWFFHCHIDWHLMQGLGMLLIEAPLQIQERVSIPQQQYDLCKAAGIPTEGNAAGSTEDYLDLRGQNLQVPI
ncbi:uncharacterized protein N7483_000684 [Penicillium malachiteum]|uniref:uncharacterized protein n=1 Tax=Penicillium malachiteum TaxID=1324776 RepID=UPI0025470D06|nr:uncharacterized protein N7483_000684 [Penicillium malachiteum]KAJ5735559.1 hypothetical protein N7483_000684 [Penicillium malachiteum]